MPQAIACVQIAARNKDIEKAKTLIPKLVQAPDLYLSNEFYSELAEAVVEFAATNIFGEPIGYEKWGSDLDSNSINQIENACKLPVSRAAALMPDAHSGYGCLLYTSPSPRDRQKSRMPSSA